MTTIEIHRPAATDRRLVVVDVENLLGCAPRDAASSLFEIAVEALLESVRYREGVDHLVIGACPEAAAKLFGVVAPHRLVIREGKDGADRALIDAVADHDHIAARFAEVVVASGDHAFVETLVQLNARHVRTTVVSRDGALNATLRIVADDVIHVASAQHLQDLALAA